MYEYTWYQWLLFFFLYCFFGWMMESTYVSIKSRRFVNRGFLRLPLLPLYGSGAIIMLWASLPFRSSLVLVFLSGMVGASILEYVTGYVMERLFKMKYWDYTDNPLNLHGYICLGTSIAWGFLTIFMTEVVHKPIEQFVLTLPPLVVIVLTGVIGFFFLADTIESTRQALDLGRTLEAMTKMKAELEELQVQMALLKAETSVKITELKVETVGKMAELKTGTHEKIAELKAGTSEKIAELKTETALQTAEAAGALKEKLQNLTDKRSKLYGHLNFYRRELLRGNPGASSRLFGEALKELKDKSLKKKK